MPEATFELRTYYAHSGRMPDLLARFRDHTIEIFPRHGMENVGYWLRTDEPETLVYVLRHTGDPAANWAQFQADPEWISVKSNSDSPTM